MDKKPTIIVGSGPILNPNLGDFVDSFARVMRFNKFVTEGWEGAVGSKITDWFFIGGNMQRKLSKWKAGDLLANSMNGLERVLIRVENKVIDPCHLELYRIFGIPSENLFIVNRGGGGVPEDRRLWVDEEFFKYIIGRLGAYPTTGILGILLVLEHYCDPPVPLVGFGPSDKFVNCHYYNDWKHDDPRDPSVKKAHPWHKERELINEWEREGLVERCDT